MWLMSGLKRKLSHDLKARAGGALLRRPCDICAVQGRSGNDSQGIESEAEVNGLEANAERRKP